MSSTARRATARVIERHVMSHPRAAVVAYDIEARVPEVTHDRDTVRGDRALRVVAVIRRTRGFVAVAIAAQISR